MKHVPAQEMVDYFQPVEGDINMYYGHIGNGKSYAATADIYELLKRGDVVFANWVCDFPDFDERRSLGHLIMKTIFFRKRFFKFPASNFHYIDVDKYEDTMELIKHLSKLANVHVFLDEGQWILDSYEGMKFSVEKRKMILHTRHYNRSLNIISQRPSAIQVSARGNVNRFYKCVKKLSWPWLVFQRSEIQEMKDEMPNENEVVSTKVYLANPMILRAYNTQAMRGADALEQTVNFEAYDLNLWDKIKYMAAALAKPKKRSERAAAQGSMGLEKKNITVKNNTHEVLQNSDVR